MANKNINEDNKATRFNSVTGRAAAKKSAESKRSNGRIREYLLMLAARPNNDIEKGADNEFAIAAGIVRRALDGDPKAVDQFVQYTGQNIIKVEANERVTPALSIGEMGGEEKEE